MPAMVPVRCPNPACGKTARVPTAAVGRATRCGRCQHRFVISEAPRDSSPAIPPDLPTHVGRFQIRARLGSGAFGNVYRAYDPQLDREVALKVPRPGTLDTPRRVERFLREARAAARMHHPGIVPVFDAGRDGNTYYIASAFIDGCTLAAAADEGPLDFRRAARIVRHLAEGLAYAHGLGIVHRDVKPANVMLDADDHPHLMDFGLAHRQDSDEKLTRDGTVLGTPAYIAPEHAAGHGAEAQPATDQYGLGVVLYELLCGRLPFEGTAQTVLFHAVHTEPKAPRRINPRVPKDLETICLKALAKRPESRYGSCQLLADDLRRWLEGEPIKARRVGVLERGVRWCRRNPALTFAGGLAAASLLAVAVVAAVAAVMVDAGQKNEALARSKADDVLRDKERADARTADYDRLLTEGILAVADNRFDQAVAAFKKAGEVPDIGKERVETAEKMIGQVENVRREIAHRKEKDRVLAELIKEYDDLLAQGAEATAGRLFDEATILYKRAAELPSLDKERAERARKLAGDVEGLVATLKAGEEEARRRAEALLADYKGFLAAGREFRKKNQFKEADAEFRKALSLEPNLIALEKLKPEDRLAQQHLTDLDNAARLADKEKTYAALLKAGKDALKKNRYDEALQKAREAMPLQPPGTREALALLRDATKPAADQALKANDFDRAIQLVEQLLAWDQADADAKGWLKQAEKEKSQALNAAANYLNQAQSAANQGFFEDAIPLLAARVNLLPTSQDAKTMLKEMQARAVTTQEGYARNMNEGAVALERKEYANAMTEFDEARKLAPSQAKAILALNARAAAEKAKGGK